MIADYQFFMGAGSLLFPNDIDIFSSPRTGKIREIREGNVHIATLNPRSGTLSLSIEGARKLAVKHNSPFVVVQKDFASEVSRGGNVFARHIAEAQQGIYAGNEAIAVSEDDSLLAVGRSLLSGNEAKRFKHGVAIKVRRGVNSKYDVQKNGSKSNAPTHE
jgi:uncharacterized protein with predicted RNA binding PUA domain